MILEPFVSVDGIPFTISREAIVKLRGEPLETGRNGVGLNELDYASVIYRFQDGGRLEEVTTQAPVVNFGNIAVPFETLPSFIQQQDPGVFERAGFVVSPRFGLAFDPDEPPWVTALAAHCLDAWRAL